MAKRKSRDRWPELCDRVSNDDGLAVRDVGPWSGGKVYIWNRYLEITTTAMVGKPQWPAGLTYIDLFAGPGISRIKGRGNRIPGSPLLAAWTPKPFRKLILCEKDQEAADACRTRLEHLPAPPDFSFFVGDCNDLIDEIVKAVPSRTLSVALIDPTGLHAHLDTICRLSECGQVDLLVLFPDAIDAVRNTEKYYLPKEKSKLDSVFGHDSGWREEWNTLPNHEASTIRRWFAEFYRKQLQKQAGYSVFGEKVIQGPKGPLYRLLFASKHPKGLEFWEKVNLKDFRGQQSLF